MRFLNITQMPKKPFLLRSVPDTYIKYAKKNEKIQLGSFFLPKIEQFFYVDVYLFYLQCCYTTSNTIPTANTITEATTPLARLQALKHQYTDYKKYQRNIRCWKKWNQICNKDGLFSFKKKTCPKPARDHASNTSLID